jgi:hypothetical protein
MRSIRYLNNLISFITGRVLLERQYNTASELSMNTVTETLVFVRFKNTISQGRMIPVIMRRPGIIIGHRRRSTLNLPRAGLIYSGDLSEFFHAGFNTLSTRLYMLLVLVDSYIFLSGAGTLVMTCSGVANLKIFRGKYVLSKPTRMTIFRGVHVGWTPPPRNFFNILRMFKILIYFNTNLNIFSQK